ncbi:hypothetical protein Mgra_00005487 [Meloidogyne graminicola]|uniref:Uncharacterized protein n=1 Tax=Meloidogyne graminicola TaxID=189291 RepID=A0A8S9ZPP2_9BILA|nr:hypothetical protein Mgra_00005487 [Meloidogyne graminicola]
MFLNVLHYTVFCHVDKKHFQQNENVQNVKLMKKIFLELILPINIQEKIHNKQKIEHVPIKTPPAKQDNNEKLKRLRNPHSKAFYLVIKSGFLFNKNKNKSKNLTKNERSYYEIYKAVTGNFPNYNRSFYYTITATIFIDLFNSVTNKTIYIFISHLLNNYNF